MPKKTRTNSYIYIMSVVKNKQSIISSIVGEMKMGNIVPRAGLKHTSLTFQASVLPFHHIGSLISPLYLRPPVYVALCLQRQCRLLHSSS